MLCKLAFVLRRLLLYLYSEHPFNILPMTSFTIASTWECRQLRWDISHIAPSWLRNLCNTSLPSSKKSMPTHVPVLVSTKLFYQCAIPFGIKEDDKSSSATFCNSAQCLRSAPNVPQDMPSKYYFPLRFCMFYDCRYFITTATATAASTTATATHTIYFPIHS